MIKIITIVILIIITNNTFGQQFTDLYGDYFGQRLPDNTPSIFAPGIVSTEKLEHSSVQINNNGDMVIWCTIDNKTKKIMQMERVKNRWTQPITLDLFEDNFEISNDGPFLTRDGKRMYFASEREKVKNPSNIESEWIQNTNSDLWYVDKIEGGWSKPVKLDTIINNNISEFQVSVSQNGNLYYVSYLPGALNDCGIYRSELKEKNYNKPLPVKLPIDSNFQNWTPYIAPDESYLIYSKCVANGDYGDLQIIYYDKDLNKWSLPQDLGEPINTWAQERFPYVSPDGKYLFFTRWTKEKNHDVFWVKADIIEKLKNIAKY